MFDRRVTDKQTWINNLEICNVLLISNTKD